MKKYELAAKEAGDEEEAAKAAGKFDLLKQQKKLFGGLRPEKAYKLFSDQKQSIPNKGSYLFTITVAGNSNAIVVL